MQHVALSDFLGTPTSTDFDHHDIYIYITMLVGNFLHDFIASWGLPSTMSRWIKRASFKHSQPYPATTPKVVNTNKLCTRLVCLPKSNWQIWAFKLSKNQPMHQIDTKTDLRVHFYSPEAWPDPTPSGTPKGSMFGSCLDEIEISWLGNMTKWYKVLLGSWEAPFLHLTVAINIISES